LTHFAFQTWLDYLDGSLLAEAQAALEDHLQTCNECQQRLADVRRLLKDEGEDQMIAPPVDLLQRVRAAFRHYHQRVDQPTPMSAQLQFDSFAHFAQLGLRGATAERQLLYSLAPFDLDLQISPDEHSGALVMRGQLLADPLAPSDLEGITVRLTGDEGRDHLRLTDALGRFSISGLPTGRYRLAIILADRQLVIEQLSIPR
jgi:hypothetical protein